MEPQIGKCGTPTSLLLGVSLGRLLDGGDGEDTKDCRNSGQDATRVCRGPAKAGFTALCEKVPREEVKDRMDVEASKEQP